MHSKELDTATNYKVYTPNEIAEEMAKKSMEHYFEGDYTEKKLDRLRVVDISCGTGNLILVALKEIMNLSMQIYGEYRYNPLWIEGYDIDSEALLEAKRRSRKLLEEYGINEEISTFCRNSITFDNHKKYNIILGNPPYLGEKNNKEIFRELKKNEFGMRYYEGKMDYFYYFIEKGIDLLEKEGVLTYITTNYWFKADHACKLRKKVREETNFRYINNYNISVFKNAPGQHNFIFTLQKSKNKDLFEVVDEGEKYLSSNNLCYSNIGKIILSSADVLKELREVYERKTHLLGDILNINQGIVSGCDKAFVFKEYEDTFSDYLKPFYKNKNIHKYTVDESSDFWILYMNRCAEADEDVLEHLSKFKEKLVRRREASKGIINWWELQWSRDEKIFNGPKIVGRQRSKENKFAYTENEFYGSADIYYLTAKHEDIDLFYILGYLNSSSFYNWFKYNGKSKGYNLELYSTPLKETPIYYPREEVKLNYVSDLVKKQLKGYDSKVQKKIDDYFRDPLIF